MTVRERESRGLLARDRNQPRTCRVAIRLRIAHAQLKGKQHFIRSKALLNLRERGGLHRNARLLGRLASVGFLALESCERALELGTRVPSRSQQLPIDIDN